VRTALASAFLALVLGNALGQVPEGGTLLIYDSLAKPFSMEDEVEPVAMLLSRFEKPVHRRSIKDLQPADLEAADRIVVVATGGFPDFDPAILEILRSTKKPLMAVGGAAPLALGEIPGKRQRPESPGECQLRYLGTRWPAQVNPWFPVAVDSSRVVAALISGKTERPLGFREGNRFGFAALPSDPPLSMVFSDVLMDFHGATGTPSPALLFIVDDFHPGCDPTSLRRLVDYFSHLGIPFAVGTQMHRLPDGIAPMPQEEYFDALRYAQTRGGRIFLDGHEAVDSSDKFQEAGIRPVGAANLETPDPAAIQIGRLYYTKNPGGEPEPFFLHAPLRLAQGGWLWPANVRGGLDGEHLDAVRSQVRRIVSFRGGVAGVVIPAWLPFQSMRDLADAARSVEAPVADPLESVPEKSKP
jgi:hypothetical protein